MDIQPISPDQSPWKVIGQGDDSKISVNGSGQVRVETGLYKATVELPIALALQSEDARAFLADPAVAPFLYAANERESRIRAARLLASKRISHLRRETVANFTELGVPIAEAWELAKLKHPIEI